MIMMDEALMTMISPAVDLLVLPSSRAGPVPCSFYGCGWMTPPRLRFQTFPGPTISARN